jgi:pimeloyl-ACP methyl ester carboxylesterase
MRIRYIELEHGRMRVLYGGTGPPLLLVHGFGVSADMWLRALPLLTPQFTVYAPDLAGHGFSDRLELADDIPERQLAAQLARLMVRLDVPRYAVIGSSLGGIIAAHLYLLHPARVQRLVFVGIDALLSDTGMLDPTVLREAMRNGLSALGDPSYENCSARLGRLCHDPAKAPAEIAYLQVTEYSMPDRKNAYCDIGQRLLRAIESKAARLDPAQIRVPALVLVGRQDTRARIDAIERNYRRIPQSELVVFEKCGHLPHIEYPERFAATVSRFLLQ